MPNSTITYVPSFLNSVKGANQEIVLVSSSVFSPQGDVFTLNFGTLNTNTIITTQSFNDLVVETSEIYPRKIVPPTDTDGSTILLITAVTSAPTASQNYYVPLRFERFKQQVTNLIDRQFIELTTGSVV